MIIHEGVRMNYTSPEWLYSDLVINKGGVVIEESRQVEAGMGQEPSGHSFMNYRTETTYTFHPYDGSAPVPCARPNGLTTRQKGKS